MHPIFIAAILQPTSIYLVGQQQWVPTQLEAVPFVTTVDSRPDAPAIRLAASSLTESKPWLSSYSAVLKEPREGRTVVFEAYIRSPNRHKIEVRIGDSLDGWLQLNPAWQLYRLVCRISGQIASPRIAIWLGDSAGKWISQKCGYLTLACKSRTASPSFAVAIMMA
jgi:hypothetical protein